MICPACKNKISNGKVFCNYCGYCFDTNYHDSMFQQEMQRREDSARQMGIDITAQDKRKIQAEQEAPEIQDTCTTPEFPLEEALSLDEKPRRKQGRKPFKVVGITIGMAAVLIGAIGIAVGLAEPKEQAPETEIENIYSAEYYQCLVTKETSNYGGTVYNFNVKAPNDSKVRFEYGDIVQEYYAYDETALFRIPAATLSSGLDKVEYVVPQITAIHPDGSETRITVGGVIVSPNDIG